MSEVETNKLFIFDKKKAPLDFEEKSTLMLTSQAIDLPPSLIIKEKNAPLKTFTHLARLDHFPDDFSASNITHSFQTYKTVPFDGIRGQRAFIKTSKIVKNYAFTQYLLQEIEDQGVGQSQIYLSSSHKTHTHEPFLTLNEKAYLKRVAFDVINLTKKIEHLE